MKHATSAREDLCPRCGHPGGSWSEGGLRWAVCQDCMDGDRRYRQDMRRQRGDLYGNAIEQDDHSKHGRRPRRPD
jgi:hypothetical protein